MFKTLQKGFEKAFSIFQNNKKIKENHILIFIKEIKKTLIESDVNIKIINFFIDKIKHKCLNTKVLINSLTPKDIMIKVVYDELVNILGKNHEHLILHKTSNIILIIGLQGSGKTTFCIKLANYLKYKKLKNPLLVSTDIYRPAAIKQLYILSRKTNIDFFNDINKNESIKEIVIKLLEYIKYNKKNDVIIIDTSGRNNNDPKMMQELKDMYFKLNPTETLFIIDAMTGQNVLYSAKIFNKLLNYTGVVLTKLDSDTKGGVALNISHFIQKSIKFISTGENIQSIYKFYPKRMAKRILGMGDILTLIEQAKEQFSKKQTKKMYKKIINNEFNFNDLLVQIKKIRKMGDFKDIISMIPGINKLVKNINLQTTSLNKIEHIISSMTFQERANPSIINKSRKKRIALGSGYNIKEVNNLIEYFYKIKNMLKNSNNSDINQIIKNIFNS